MGTPVGFVVIPKNLVYSGSPAIIAACQAQNIQFYQSYGISIDFDSLYPDGYRYFSLPVYNNEDGSSVSQQYILGENNTLSMERIGYSESTYYTYRIPMCCTDLGGENLVWSKQYSSDFNTNIFRGEAETQALLETPDAKEMPAANYAWNYKAYKGDPLQWHLPTLSCSLVSYMLREVLNITDGSRNSPYVGYEQDLSNFFSRKLGQLAENVGGDSFLGTWHTLNWTGPTLIYFPYNNCQFNAGTAHGNIQTTFSNICRPMTTYYGDFEE